MEMYDTVTDLKGGVPVKKKEYPLTSLSQVGTKVFGTANAQRKEGDIWEIPQGLSPMWTKQWGYQGSSKTPYVISYNPERINGSTTDEGWACSCPNFTRHTPRTPCKHILNVMLKAGMASKAAKGKAVVANASDSELAEFQKWQREKAAAKKDGPAKDAKLNLFGATGRKFR